MRALIAKEWRENRALILGFLLIAPVLSLGLKWLVSDMRDGALASASVLYYLPGMLGLFLFAIASDLVAADVSSGRIRFLAALPVSPAKVWAAKAVFLYGSAALYLVYLIGVEFILLPWFGHSGTELLGPDASAQTVWFLYLAVGGAATLFMSTLIDRGFAAAFAALLLLGGLWLAVEGLRREFRILAVVSESAEVFRVAVGIVGAGLLLGSYLAFSRGRIHLGRRVRRAMIAFAGLLLVAVPPALHAESRIRGWENPAPGDADVRLTFGGVSPDRRFAIAHGWRSGPGPFGLVYGHVRATWAVPLDGGPIVDLRELVPARSWFDGFEPEGHAIRMLTQEKVDGNEFVVVRLVDPEKREVIRTRVRSQDISPAVAQYSAPLPEGVRVAQRTDWADIWRKGRTVTLVTSGEDGGHHRLPKPETGWWSTFIVPEEPSDTILGFRLWMENGASRTALVPIRWREGTLGEPIASGPSRGWTAPPGGHHSLVLFHAGAWIVDRRDASARAVPDLADIRHFSWSADGSRFFAALGERFVVGAMDEEGKITFEEGLFPGLVRPPAWFDGELALVIGPGGDTLDLTTKDGANRRLLPRRED